MRFLREKKFANGVVYALETEDGYPVEVTDTFLPYYTKDAVGRKQNSLDSCDLGSRSERWMIGVSTMSGCPIGCKFCATGNMKKWRKLTSVEILQQIHFVLERNEECDFSNAKEHKINYTRMGEPFLNIDSVKKAISSVDKVYPGTHHYVSTIGVSGSDFSWVRDNITLQVSLHSLDDERRDWLIPFSRKMTIEELGKIRTGSDLKTTVNLTLVDESDFDIDRLRRHFDPEHFFVKISPINENDISAENELGSGVILGNNLV